VCLGPLYTADMIYTGNRAGPFDGTDGNGIFHTHMEWRGALWSQHQNMSPPSRGLNSMAYDGDSNVVVLFAGVDIDSNLKILGSSQ
jgi:hypothetical protein